MKILHLSTYDTAGGAARAAYRLHNGLLADNLDSMMLVQDKLIDDDNILGPSGSFSKFSARYLRPRIDALPSRIYPWREATPFHSQWIPGNVHRKINTIAPDIVHIHWINDGMINIEELAAINRPIVWTLHDMWPFTGGCHYAGECTRYTGNCGKCPQLHSKLLCDLSSLNLFRKKRFWTNPRITIVTPSQWLARCAKSSSLFRNNRIEVIPNGIDLDLFHPVPKATARKALKLAADRRVILFGAVKSTSDRRKGFHFLQSALKNLNEKSRQKAELLVFGACPPDPAPDFGLNSRYIGTLHDDISLPLLYSSADIFVCPSLEDNLPNTIVESLACGIPCVAFNIGGMPDMIDHMENGYLATPYDPEELASGIDLILSDTSKHKSYAHMARLKAEKHFDIKIIAKKYLALYEEVLNQ